MLGINLCICIYFADQFGFLPIVPYSYDCPGPMLDYWIHDAHIHWGNIVERGPNTMCARSKNEVPPISVISQPTLKQFLIYESLLHKTSQNVFFHLMQPSGTRNCWLMTLSMHPGMQAAPYNNPRNILLNPIVLVAFT